MPSSISLSILPTLHTLLTLTLADQGGLAPPPMADEAAAVANAGDSGEAASAPPAGDPAKAVNRYAGLSLAPEAKNPLPTPKEEPPRLMWTGFQPTETGGEIFLQTSRGVVHDVAMTTGPAGQPTLSVFLRNCRIHWRNNARRIDTSYFATAVAGVVARQRKRDVELVLSLKQAVVPVVRTAPGPNGSQLIVLAFPPGERAPAPTTADPGAAAAAPAASVSPPSPPSLR